MKSHTLPRISKTTPALFAGLLLGCLTFLAIDQMQPPAAAPVNAPATEFSSARAMEQLKLIAQEPHPTGSPENARVREYVVKQLTTLGVPPEIQTTTVVSSGLRRHGPTVAATVSNIVARLQGTQNTKAVMLAAHYDSVPIGPGASDDGSGVATLVETLRALRAGRPLKNDVMFLFTDGEELGLLGAKAFVDEHPWAKDVGVALNFDARGACGPSFMFETSPHNGWLIREFAKAAPHPVTSSVMYDGYKRIPNRTDFTLFKGAGTAGLNFAYVGCWPRYHTSRDTVRNIDQRSLQHHGSYALALARHFGNLSPEITASNETLYFSFFGAIFFYSQAWGVPLMVVVLALFIGVVRLGFKRHRLTRHGIALGFAVWLAGALVAVAVSQLSWLALRKTRLVSLLPYGRAYNGDLYALAFTALTIAVISALYVSAFKQIRVENLTVGALLWWLILTILASLYFRGASFLFAWPLLFSLVELGYAFGQKKRESEVAEVLIWTLPAIVGIFLVVPTIDQLLMLLGATGLVSLTGLVALLLGFLVPHVHVMTAHRRRFLPSAAALVALGLIIAAIFRSGFDSKHPRADSVFYALNADTAKAVWASVDQTPDEWTSQFLMGRVEKADLSDSVPFAAPVLESPAPTAPLPAPNVATLDDLTMGEGRILRLWITSPRQARVAWVIVPNAKVMEAKVNDKPIATGDASSGEGKWGFSYVGLPRDGIVLTLETKASEPLAIKVIDQSDGLPEFPGRSFKPRPDTLMPTPWPPFDSSTLVSKTFRFEGHP